MLSVCQNFQNRKQANRPNDCEVIKNHIQIIVGNGTHCGKIPLRKTEILKLKDKSHLFKKP